MNKYCRPENKFSYFHLKIGEDGYFDMSSLTLTTNQIVNLNF